MSAKRGTTSIEVLRFKRCGSRWHEQTGAHVVQLRALALSDRSRLIRDLTRAWRVETRYASAMTPYLLALVTAVAPWVPGQALELEVGEARVIRVRGVRFLVLPSASITDVRTMAGDDLRVTGAAEGTTTILLGTTDGKRLWIPVRVVAKRPRPTPIAVTKSTGRAIGADGGVSGSLEVFEFQADLVDVREAPSADGDVHFVGTDRSGAKYDLVLTPRP